MSATKKVIFYLIDGARPDILKKLAEKGHLPNIQRHLIEEGSFSKGSTCFPSTTGPAYLPYLTGAFPGDHHITGIRWFDKMEYFSNGLWTRNSMRSYCGYEAAYFNDDMDSTLPSLFEEYEDGINLYNMITKGVREENDVTKKGKTGLYFRAHFKHEHHQVDKAGHLHLMDSLHKESRFTFAVFPSIDWDSHTYHFDDPETTHQAYKIADDSLGEVVEQLKARNEYQDTLMIMASDHGLSSTHTHLDLGNFFRSHKYRVMEYPLFFKWRPQVAIFISGNSFATISFLDKKGLYGWNDLRESHHEVIDNLLAEDAVDFVLCRAEKGYVVQNNEGYATIYVTGDMLTYHPQTADVFKIGEISNPVDFASSHECTFETEYPDCLWQCHQLMKSHRSGDMVISAATGYDLRDFWEIPEHKGSHGSLHWEHMHVPLLSNQPDMFTQPLRTTSVHGIIKNWIHG